MLTCTNEITVSLNGQTSFETVTAMQGDSGSRRLNIRLTENDIPFSVPAGTIARLFCRLPNKAKASCDCTVNSDGTITAALSEAMLSIAGNIKLQVVLKYEDSTLSSVIFPVRVVPAMAR